MEFFTFGCGQAVAALTLIQFCLLDPLAHRLNCGLELARQRRYAAAATRQLNHSTPVLRCVWWIGSGHLENSFSLSPTPSTKLGQLQGAGPGLRPRSRDRMRLGKERPA